MSQFLPESTPTQPQSSATFSPTPQVNPDDVALMQRVFNAAAQNPQMIPDALLSYVLDWLQVNNLQIPIGQVFGFQRFVSTQVSAYADGGQSVGMAANTFASAAGPSLNLPAGKYIVIGGIETNQLNGPQLTFVTGGSFTVIGGASGDYTKAALFDYTGGASITTTISGTGQGAGGSISNSWLIAIRYDNA